MVTTIAPAAWIDLGSATLTASATVALFESGSRSLDGRLGATTYSAPIAGWRGEVAGEAGASSFNETRTTYSSGVVRAHRMRDGRGFWLGVGAGYIGDGLSDPGSFRAESGGWLRKGFAAASARATHSRMAHVRYTDMEGAVRFTSGRVELATSAGTRAGGLGDDARIWGDVGATAWVAPRIALVAGYGRYPAEHPRSLPGGRYLSLAVRVASRDPGVADAAARVRRYEAPRIGAPVVAAFEVRAAGGEQRSIRIRAPGARSVEIKGDFTDWEALALTRQGDGSWRVLVRLPPGTYRINVRVDGGEWGVPPGTGVMRDEFGGVVGILVLRINEQ